MADWLDQNLDAATRRFISLATGAAPGGLAASI